MFDVTCLDKYGNTVTNLTQWDLNQTLYIENHGFTTAPQFHFCNKNSERALIVQSTIVDDMLQVVVPNILLTEPYTITAYVYLSEDNSGKTVEYVQIPVRQRPQPNNFEYEDNAVIIDVKELADEMRALNASMSSAEEARVKAENTRVANEKTRASNENARKTAETARVSAETARVNAENTRESNEGTRKSNEDARKTAETARTTAESTRVSNENTRKSNESSRKTAETNRATAETARVDAEKNRVTAETTRSNAEQSRVDAETARVTAENKRISAETTRQSQETSRQTNTATAITNAERATERANHAAEACEGIIEGTGLIPSTEKGRANGVATLDENALIPINQIPTIVGASGARNLIPYPYSETTHTDKGITWTDNGDGTFTANGTATAVSFFYISIFESKLELYPGEYTISGGVELCKFYIAKISKVDSVRTYMIGGTSCTFIAEEGYYYEISVRVESGNTVDNVVIKPMLVKGSIAHDFVPFYFGGAKNAKNANTLDGLDSTAFAKTAGATFTGSTYFDYGAWGVNARNKNIVKGTNPSTTQYIALNLLENEGTAHKNRLATLQTSVDTNGIVQTAISAFKNEKDATVSTSLGVVYDTANNATYAYAPTPSNTTDNSNKIATTAWVNGFALSKNGTALTSQDLDDVKTQGLYFGAGGNTVTNKPSGVAHFGLFVYKLASGYIAQELTDEDKVYYRFFNSTTWSAWTERKFTDTTTLSSMTGTLSVGQGGTGATTLTDVKKNLGVPLTIRTGTYSATAPTNNGWYKIFEVPSRAWGSFAFNMDIYPCNCVNNPFIPATVSVILKMSSATTSAPSVYLEHGNPTILSNFYIVQNNNSATDTVEFWYKDAGAYSEASVTVYNYHQRTTDYTLNQITISDSPTTPLDSTTEGKNGVYCFSDILIDQTVNGYTIESNVPSDAVFTDTNNVAYGTCSTAAGTAAKVITISGNTSWKLTAGAIITVKFSATNIAQNPTFNVNSTGAKSVWYNTALITTSSLGYAGTANRPMQFVYDGTQYVFMGWALDNNTTYSNASLGCGYGTCSTAEATTEKAVTLSSYTLATGGFVAVKFTNAVPANATMNINSKGAKAIYYKGSAITANVIKAGDTATFVYNGTYYHVVSIDRDNNSDTKVTISANAPTSATNYYPTMHTETSGTTAVTANTNIKFQNMTGTTSVQGYNVLILGNETAKGTASNSYGVLRLFGDNTNYTQIKAGAVTANRTITLPNASGTLELTGHTQAANTITAGELGGEILANVTAAATLGNAQLRNIVIKDSVVEGAAAAETNGTIIYTRS